MSATCSPKLALRYLLTISEQLVLAQFLFFFALRKVQWKLNEASRTYVAVIDV